MREKEAVDLRHCAVSGQKPGKKTDSKNHRIIDMFLTKEKTKERSWGKKNKTYAHNCFTLLYVFTECGARIRLMLNLKPGLLKHEDKSVEVEKS